MDRRGRKSTPAHRRAARAATLHHGGFSAPPAHASHQATKGAKTGDKANEPTGEIFASFFLSVRKMQATSRASVIQYLARRRGGREEISESGETPDPQTSANLCYLCGKKTFVFNCSTVT